MRRADWELRYHALLDNPGVFTMPGNDCHAFVCRVVRNLTGYDISGGTLELYKTEAEAEALIKQRGGMRAFYTKAMGRERPPMLACRGDVVLLRYGHGGTMREAVGIATGHRAHFITKEGLRAVLLKSCECSWSIDVEFPRG